MSKVLDLEISCDCEHNLVGWSVFNSGFYCTISAHNMIKVCQFRTGYTPHAVIVLRASVLSQLGREIRRQWVWKRHLLNSSRWKKNLYFRNPIYGYSQISNNNFGYQEVDIGNRKIFLDIQKDWMHIATHFIYIYINIYIYTICYNH